MPAPEHGRIDARQPPRQARTRSAHRQPTYCRLSAGVRVGRRRDAWRRRRLAARRPGRKAPAFRRCALKASDADELASARARAAGGCRRATPTTCAGGGSDGIRRARCAAARRQRTRGRRGSPRYGAGGEAAGACARAIHSPLSVVEPVAPPARLIRSAVGGDAGEARRPRPLRRAPAPGRSAAAARSSAPRSAPVRAPSTAARCSCQTPSPTQDREAQRPRRGSGRSGKRGTLRCHAVRPADARLANWAAIISALQRAQQRQAQDRRERQPDHELAPRSAGG